MKDDQEQTGGALVSSSSRALTRNSSGLVRRGLDDLKLSAERIALYLDANQRESSRPAFDEETYEKAKRFFYRGRAKQDDGDLGGAIVDFDKAIEIDPRHARYYFRRGGAKRGNGDLDGAIADYTRAIEINQGDAFAYNNRAAVKRLQGDLEGALADYDKAIETCPGYLEAYNNRGAAKQSNGDLDGAVADYTKAIEIEPRVTDFYFGPRVAMAYALRGFAYLWQARDADAQQDFARCLELDGSQGAWIEREAEEICLKRGVERTSSTFVVDIDGALAEAMEVIKAYPSTPPVVEPAFDTLPEQDEDDHPHFSETEIARQLKDMAQYLDDVEEQANSDKQWKAARANDPLYQQTTFEHRKANRLKAYEAFLRKGKEGIREHLDRVRMQRNQSESPASSQRGVANAMSDHEILERWEEMYTKDDMQGMKAFVNEMNQGLTDGRRLKRMGGGGLLITSQDAADKPTSPSPRRKNE